MTIQEVDNEMRLANVPTEKRKDPEILKRILNEIVTRKYMVKQALDAKLDREPTVLLDILRSRELVSRQRADHPQHDDQEQFDLAR